MSWPGTPTHNSVFSLRCDSASIETVPFLKQPLVPNIIKANVKQQPFVSANIDYFPSAPLPMGSLSKEALVCCECVKKIK